MLFIMPNIYTFSLQLLLKEDQSKSSSSYPKPSQSVNENSLNDEDIVMVVKNEGFYAIKAAEFLNFRKNLTVRIY